MFYELEIYSPLKLDFIVIVHLVFNIANLPDLNTNKRLWNEHGSIVLTLQTAWRPDNDRLHQRGMSNARCLINIIDIVMLANIK